MNYIKNIWKCFEEAFCFCKMALSDILFCCIQYGCDCIPVSCIYVFTWDFGNWSGWYRIYVVKISMNLFGVKFTWSLLGYNVLRDAAGNVLIGGGLGYFISYELGSFLAQCINFPLQRNITFKSHGNPVYQAIWYFIAWVVISLICNGFNNLWMPVASAYVAPAVYNLLVTIITGGVSMVIFFFVFKIIFPEGKAE